jgi:hypothetical protein
MGTLLIRSLKQWLNQKITTGLDKTWLRQFVAIVMSAGLIWCQPIAAQAQTTPAKPSVAPATKPVLLSAPGGTSTTPQVLSDTDRAKLKDPLFQLVLKDHADVTTMADINKLLSPASQDVFAVDEHIIDAAPKVGDSLARRRSVITMKGVTNNQTLDQNVLFSVMFNSEQFPTPSFIEAMGWDDTSGSFNYYKLDQFKGEPTATWKFRGNSRDADTLSTASRQGTCMQCHINGAPVMKELREPWNNWKSFSSPIPYLTSGNGSWPVVNAVNSPLQNLKGAQSFELNTVRPAISRFNQRRIDTLKSSDGNTIVDAKRLLKPLFVTTEFNLTSSKEARSSLHPFRKPGIITDPVEVPSTFFLDDNLLGLLNISTGFTFADLSGQDYDHLLRQTKTSLNDQQPGDTNFTWSVPEASFIDNDWVQQVSKQNIVPRAFVLAALAIDLENPVLSSDRAKLWSDKVLPAQFKVGPTNDLIPQVVKNLETLKPAIGTPEAKFLQLLRQPDTVEATLKSQVDQYVSREINLLGNKANPLDRSREWIRLYKLALQRREAVLADPTLRSLDETGGKLLMARGDVTATVATLPSAATVATSPTPSKMPSTVRFGDQGNDVLTLQRRLSALGLFSGKADGDFGRQTQTAVIAAQHQFKLTEDGVVGPSTWAALQGAIS